MSKEELPYSYKKHGHDRYYGRVFLSISECSGKNQFRVQDNMLAIDVDGNLGVIGLGAKWFMNYITRGGACSFNPVPREDVVWAPYHNAYVYKSDLEHFRWPVIVGQFYTLEGGVKRITHYGLSRTVSLLPKTTYPARCPYL